MKIRFSELDQYLEERDQLFKEHGHWYYETAWKMSPHWRKWK